MPINPAQEQHEKAIRQLKNTLMVNGKVDQQHITAWALLDIAETLTDIRFTLQHISGKLSR